MNSDDRVESALGGRVAIVTGAGHGLGRSHAQRLAEAGARVVIAELDGEAGDQAAEEIRAQGYDAVSVHTDVSDHDSTHKLAETTFRRWHRIDILINNAALFDTIPLYRVPFDQIDKAEWDAVLNGNLTGSWLTCCAVVPYMRQRHYGKIVNVSFTTAFKAYCFRAHYVASEAGVAGLTRTLAMELGSDGIRVNCLVPGSTLNESNPSHAVLAMRSAESEQQAIPGVLTPDDISKAILFLCSPASDAITGQSIFVNHGLHMQ